MKTKLPISLVVPCYNRRQQTRRLLDSLEKSEYQCQIILIDDCSRENIKGIINDFMELEIKYYRNSKNCGPAFSRNEGIRLADYELIAFTDNDCIVTGDWLKKLYDSINNAKPNIAGVGGKIIAKNNDLISQYFIYHKILDPWFYNGQFLYLVTANSIYKKGALLKVGGFDDTIKFAGGEDPGLCFKLLNKGFGFLYSPEAIIIHEFQRGILSFIKTFYRYGVGCSIQSKKYYKQVNYLPNENYAGLIDNFGQNDNLKK